MELWKHSVEVVVRQDIVLKLILLDQVDQVVVLLDNMEIKVEL
jgi:hypothetical protein